MQRIVKQSVGIDVAQKELVVTLGRLYDDFNLELFAHKTFVNSTEGFDRLLAWINKMMDNKVQIRFVMEATGVYHESLAYYLFDRNKKVSVVVPNKISNYHRTLSIKTVTDKTASETIARFGLERSLEDWVRPNKLFKLLRQLVRERGQIIDERTVVKNQLHAEQVEAEPNQKSITRLNERLALLNKQEKEIYVEAREIAQKDSEVAKIIRNLCSIPGIGELTAIAILGETNGFNLIRSKKQLVSYAGLDVREKQSGTSVKGKATISKRGNRVLRKTMYMPAMAALKNEGHFRDIFVRLVSKHGIKMKAAVAVQRKMLELCYILYKTDSQFNPKYQENNSDKKELGVAIVATH